MSFGHFDFAGIAEMFACDEAPLASVRMARGGCVALQLEDQEARLTTYPFGCGENVLSQGCWKCKLWRSSTLILTVEKLPHDDHEDRTCL